MQYHIFVLFLLYVQPKTQILNEILSWHIGENSLKSFTQQRYIYAWWINFKFSEEIRQIGNEIFNACVVAYCNFLVWLKNPKIIFFNFSTS